MNLCQYANIFGKENEGVHKYKIGNVAIVDFMMTIGAAIILSYIPNSPPFTIWLILLLIFSMALHKIFCTRTSVLTWIENNRVFWIVITVILVVCLGYLLTK